MTKDEALKLALEALEWSYGGEPMPTKELKAINAIRQALADQKGSEMTKDKALNVALEALGDIVSARSRGFGIAYIEGYATTTIKQLRQALAEWTPDDTAYRPDGLSQDSDQLPDTTKMIDKDFALNVALEALHNFADDESVDGWKAIDAIGVARKALSELPPVKSYCGGKPNYCEPELVGYVYQNELQGMTLGAYSCTEIYPDDSTGRIPLYTAPPNQVASVADVSTSDKRVPNLDKQRHEWVGLTNEEREDLWQSHIKPLWGDMKSISPTLFACKVEAKLKEKNNG